MLLFDVVKTTVNPSMFPEIYIHSYLLTSVSLIATCGVIDVYLSESVLTITNYTKAFDHAKAFNDAKALDYVKALEYVKAFA